MLNYITGEERKIETKIKKIQNQNSNGPHWDFAFGFFV
jgi:hypothetical protein